MNLSDNPQTEGNKYKFQHHPIILEPPKPLPKCDHTLLLHCCRSRQGYWRRCLQGDGEKSIRDCSNPSIPIQGKEAIVFGSICPKLLFPVRITLNVGNRCSHESEARRHSPREEVGSIGKADLREGVVGWNDIQLLSRVECHIRRVGCNGPRDSCVIFIDGESNVCSYVSPSWVSSCSNVCKS
jgi:hypothetical protein